MLVAERSGPIRIIRNDVLDAEPVWSAAGVAAGNELKWLALHPRFAANRLVYLSYPKSGERGTTLAVARGRFDGRQLDDVEEIFVADAWETGGNLGGKILFGPDETLYVTVGDRDRLCCTGTEDNSLRMKAQDLGNHVGKTLRIRDDGSVPPDNPFVGRAGAKPEIFTYGHRNGYGLGVSSRDRRALAGRDRADGRRRGQHLAAGPQLRLAARVDGAQLHGLARVSDQPFCARRHGQRAHVLGAVDQPVELDVLHGRALPAVARQHVRRRAERLEPAARRVRSTVAGGAARAGAARARNCASATCSRPATASSTSRPSAGSAAPRPTARCCGSSPSKARSASCDVARRALA